MRSDNISPVLAVRSGDWKFLMDEDGNNRQLYNIKIDYREEHKYGAKRNTRRLKPV